ncbi:hypothetical protein EXIGLDRAFT_716557 [Exidia glandulosa HHB12029]|uniref:RING-type domain-containing protein n=1 Tax=Exidia glandulosa HHB12029 TaxID=1314781 RepID=A0A165IVC9_EXIGL|nr:hypothetical protein EXIGLDRAFT_716557 [Exidia glandulosa HHB12029]
MTKHSKNNTASSVFSYSEYKRLDYGTKRQRLGNESMRRFDACSLCLQRAREPLACPSGHLFCKECIYTDLLQQRSDIKRHKSILASIQKQEDEERTAALAAARERVLKDFERGQLNVGKSLKEKADAAKAASASDAAEPRGVKRKFEFDSSVVDEQMRIAEEAALRKIEREQAEARKAKLPDFWLPSLTPDAAPTKEKEKDAQMKTMCRIGEPAHPLAMKNLIPVSFTPDGSSSSSNGAGEEGSMCPSCKKALSNNTFMFLMAPCSHVICKTCTETLVKPGMQCVQCDKTLKEKDLIEMKREGTGFAGGGLAEAKKKGVAFQG